GNRFIEFVVIEMNEAWIIQRIFVLDGRSRSVSQASGEGHENRTSYLAGELHVFLSTLAALLAALATFRINPTYLARRTGECRKRVPNSSSVRRASSSSRGANSTGANAGSSVTAASRFQGHTSWQMSQPNR